MHVELVRTTTRDGLRLDGALVESVESRSPAPDSRPSAAILLHGVAGNFYTSSTFDAVIPKLRELGLAVLSVNTRGHDSVFGSMAGNVRRRFGAAYETVDDCRLDIGAWIELLSSRGHASVVLIGHSLGAIKAVYAQAHEKWPQVAAVIAASPPRLSYSAFMNSAESSVFWESFSTAERMVAEGRGEELFTGKFPFPLLITAAGYVDKYGPAERYNILRFAADLPCPALFTYGSKELAGGGIAFEGLPKALLALPVSSSRTIMVIEGADHVYAGVADDLAVAISGWFKRTFNESLLNELRARARQDAKATELIRWLHAQTTEGEMPLLDVLRTMQAAFDLSLKDVKPIGGWSATVEGELSDDRLNALVQPGIQAWLQRGGTGT